MAAPVGPRWPDREEKEKRGGGWGGGKHETNTGNEYARRLELQAPSERWGKLSCALQVLSGCFPAAGGVLAAPVSFLSTCSTFCCPSVSYWQRLCRLRVCQLYVNQTRKTPHLGNRVRRTVSKIPHGWSRGLCSSGSCFLTCSCQ